MSLAVIHPERIRAAIFDLDGVVTRTARVHATAWKDLFDDYLRQRAEREGTTFRPFDAEEDYRRHVDGKPRYDGVRDFLASRGIELPEGDPDDPPDRETVRGLGNRKNALFHQRLEHDGVQICDGALDLIARLRAAGVHTAVVSASRNCAAVLEAAGIADRFEARVDGVEADRLGLAGKPAPDSFLEAARRLGVGAGSAAVLEDSVAGVAAGHRGGFGLVIGVDSTGHPRRLLDGGADTVVGHLGLVRVRTDDAEGTPPSALEALDRIAGALRGRRPALFLDYDGTLTPIVDRPEDAVLSESMRRALQRTGRHLPLAILSGRDLADVRERVGLPELVYAGSHGFDIAGPDGLRYEHRAGERARPALEAAADALEERLAEIPGHLVERKAFALAVHYRQVPEDRHGDVEATVRKTGDEHPELRLTGGKKVWELRPDVDWDKGRALLWLLDTLDLDGPEVLPFYLGDDETDEDAFRALEGRGLGVLVADRPRTTAADFRLADPGDVAGFLERLEQWENNSGE